MGLFGKGNSGRAERAEMEQNAKHGQNEESSQEKLLQQTGDEKFAKTYRNRGKLYDKIKVSVHTMDIIIYTVAGLLILALVVGIAIGN